MNNEQPEQPEIAIKRFCDLQHEIRFVGLDGDVNAGTRRYQYVTLNNLRIILDPYFQKYKLGFSQPLDIIDGQDVIRTLIFDRITGEIVIQSVTKISPRTENNPQDKGAAITYNRRYSLMSILGIVGEKDDDCFLEDEEIKNRLEESSTLDELKKLYASLRPEQKKEYKTLFSKRKDEIQDGILDSVEIK